MSHSASNIKSMFPCAKTNTTPAYFPTTVENFWPTNLIISTVDVPEITNPRLAITIASSNARITQIGDPGVRSTGGIEAGTEDEDTVEVAMKPLSESWSLGLRRKKRRVAISKDLMASSTSRAFNN